MGWAPEEGSRIAAMAIGGRHFVCVCGSGKDGVGARRREPNSCNSYWRETFCVCLWEWKRWSGRQRKGAE